jgi:hypothetical protein
VGKAFGVTRERIRQIEAKALEVRHPSERANSGPSRKPERPHPGLGGGALESSWNSAPNAPVSPFLAATAIKMLEASVRRNFVGSQVHGRILRSDEVSL